MGSLYFFNLTHWWGVPFLLIASIRQHTSISIYLYMCMYAFMCGCAFTLCI